MFRAVWAGNRKDSNKPSAAADRRIKEHGEHCNCNWKSNGRKNSATGGVSGSDG